MAIWMLVLGAALIGLAAYEAIVTTISTASAAGPVTMKLGRSFWWLAHRLARKPTSAVLVAAGPLILVATITVWLALLWVGWTLVFSADPSAVVSDLGDQPADWSERAYFAGFTAFTLGVGDYVPMGAPWQLLTVVATISGLGLTTAAITYLLPIATASTERSQQAMNIAGLGATPQEMVRNAYVGGSVRFLEPVLLQLTDSLLMTAQRHLSYPILHYFHPRSVEAELRVQLAALDDALTLVEHGLGDGVETPHPLAISGLRAAVAQVLDRAGITEPSTPLDLQLAPLRDEGIPVADEETFSRRLEALADHRGRLATYSQESKWPRALAT